MGSSPAWANVSRGKKKRAPFERRVTRYAALLVTPCFVASAILTWLQPWSLQSKLLLIGAQLLASLLIGLALYDHIIRPLQTLANVVGALREQDYSFRARMAVPNDALGELSLEGLIVLLVLAHLGVQSLEVLMDLRVVVSAHDPRELGHGVLDKEVAELSVDVGLHVA